MTLYDEYRKEHPVAAEPSEFREIIEAEVKRALEWMRGRDDRAPSEPDGPGRYMMLETNEMMVDVVQGRNGLWVRSGWVMGMDRGWTLPLEYLVHKGATFRKVE